MVRWKSAIVAFLLSLMAVAQAGSATDDEAKKAIEEFKKAYTEGAKKNDESARATAVSGLANVYHPLVTKTLVGILNGDPSLNVQKAAASALARPGDDDAVTGVGMVIEANKTNKKASDLVLACIDTLGSCDSERALNQIHVMFKHYKDGVAKEAVNQAEKIADPISIDPILALLRLSDSERHKGATAGGGANAMANAQDKDLVGLYEPCLKALKACSGGADGGKDFKEWDAWWKKSGGSLKKSTIYWCPGTRQSFEVKPGDKKLCPYDGDKVKDCGVFLKMKVAQ